MVNLLLEPIRYADWILNNIIIIINIQITILYLKKIFKFLSNNNK